MTITRQYQLDFTTPAFLGNAQQRAQWRTPPIKALLRQWWRVHAQSQPGLKDLASMREKEGECFGVAADEDSQSQRSRVRLRLSTAWIEGKAAEWPRSKALTHPNVNVPVQADLYLGFGPITTKERRAALLPGTTARLSIAAPDDFPLDELMQLVARFGTLGSRSRNSWGSLAVEGIAKPSAQLLGRISRPLVECLREDWPHALGRDEAGLLMWKTRPQKNWRDAMRELARVKIAFRTQFQFQGGKKHREFHPRFLLAYPVTNHELEGYKKSDRSANQLRFKVVQENESCIGLAFHLPHAWPLSGGPLPQRQTDIWRAVHAVLDREMTRMGDGQ